MKRLLNADFENYAQAEEAYEDAVARSIIDADKKEKERAGISVKRVPVVPVLLRRSTRVCKQPQSFGLS